MKYSNNHASYQKVQLIQANVQIAVFLITAIAILVICWLPVVYATIAFGD